MKYPIRNCLYVEITSKWDHCWKMKRFRDKFSLWESQNFWDFFTPKWRIFKGKRFLMRSWKVRFLKKECNISIVPKSQNFSNRMKFMTLKYLDNSSWIANVMVKWFHSLVISGGEHTRRWGQLVYLQYIRFTNFEWCYRWILFIGGVLCQ